MEPLCFARLGHEVLGISMRDRLTYRIVVSLRFRHCDVKSILQQLLKQVIQMIEIVIWRPIFQNCCESPQSDRWEYGLKCASAEPKDLYSSSNRRSLASKTASKNAASGYWNPVRDQGTIQPFS